MPMVAPAAALLVSLTLALRAGYASIPLALAGIGLGWALGSRSGLFVVAGFLGALCGWMQVGAPGLDAAPILLDRPVEIVGATVGPWTRSRFGWSVPLRCRYVRQGNDLTQWQGTIRVYVGRSDRNLPVGQIRAKGYLKRSFALGTNRVFANRLWSLSSKSARFVRQDPLRENSRWSLIAFRLRSRIENLFESLDAERRGVILARALVLGDVSQVPKRWIRGLRRAGLAHLLAVSGLHAGILAGFVLLVTYRLPFLFRILLACASLICYLAVIGPRPGLVRSSGMAVLACFSIFLERPPQVGNMLAVAAVLLVAAQPDLVNDLGFQLTMSATAGIVYLSPHLSRRWHLVPLQLRSPLAMGVSAQVASMPWLLPYANILSPIAPFLNLIAIPWTGVTLIAAYFWGFVSLVLPWAGLKLLTVLDWLSLPFDLQADLRPALFGVVPVKLGFGSAALVTASLVAALLCRRVAVLGVVAVVMLLSLGGGSHPTDPTLVMLNVGQGDSLLIQDGTSAVLVDGGGLGRRDMATSVLLPALAKRGVRRLSAVVLTHSDFDHCGGLADIIAYIPVEEVWIAPGGGDSPCGFELLSTPWLRLRVAWEGSRIEVGRWSLTSLHPPPGSRFRGNDQSLVLVAAALDRRILLTGDLEDLGERALISKYGTAGLHADILKVAHHGSNSSTSSRFLAVVRPRLALISAGVGNRYGHPSQLVLDRLQAHGIGVLRTDQLGDIDLQFLSGHRLKILSSRNRP